MLHEALRTLLGALEVLRPAFTRPGFENLLVVFAGWTLTSGPHAVTQALVTTGVASRRHHEAFHRFLSRGTCGKAFRSEWHSTTPLPRRRGRTVFAFGHCWVVLACCP